MILFVTAFITNWNDYMTMVIWLPSYPSLAYGMYKFSTNSSTGASWPPIQISGCMILMIPILAIFIALKDKIIGNITIGTLK
jgi:ABC-type glycerol-3-phosphate transport system permease component